MGSRIFSHASGANRSRARILVVDDDPNIPRAVEIRFGGRFEVVCAVSGAQALELIDTSEPFAVVLADMRMPGLDGTNLLKQVREHSPDTTRILMTSDSDLGSAVEAMNRGHLFRLVTKPWKGEDVMVALRDGVDEHQRRLDERRFLEGTLQGSVEVLIELLSFGRPAEFGVAKAVGEKACMLADQFEEVNSWEIRLAAVLAPIGVMCLPEPPKGGERDKEAEGRLEQARRERVPRIGFDLLHQIPRLDQVARIVLYQHKHYDGKGTPDDGILGSAIPLGARILKVAWDLNELLTRGLYLSAALRVLHGRPGWYDPRVLEVARHCRGLDHRLAAGRRRERKSLPLVALLPGHIVMEDIETEDGIMLVAAGRQISDTILEGLRVHAESVVIKEPIVISTFSDPIVLDAGPEAA